MLITFPDLIFFPLGMKAQVQLAEESSFNIWCLSVAFSYA